MPVPFYDFENERTIFSDNTFGMIGRALTFATSFENNCRGLNTIFWNEDKKSTGGT